MLINMVKIAVRADRRIINTSGRVTGKRGLESHTERFSLLNKKT